MAKPLKAKSTYVFGVVSRGGGDTNLVFIPEPEARRLAAINQAICTSKTWFDFTRQMPADDLQEVVCRFIEDDEPLPNNEDKFVVDFATLKWPHFDRYIWPHR